MRISDWSSDVCSSDLATLLISERGVVGRHRRDRHLGRIDRIVRTLAPIGETARQGQLAATDIPSIISAKVDDVPRHAGEFVPAEIASRAVDIVTIFGIGVGVGQSRRSEEHTSELQSLMRISYAVFCLKK